MWKWPAMFGMAALVVVTMTSVGGSDAHATVTGGGMCWVPDWEFPIPCDDIDED